MSIHEKLAQVQREGKGLTERIRAREKLEKFKKDCKTVVFPEDAVIARAKDDMLASGVIDMLIELVDIFPPDSEVFALAEEKDYVKGARVGFAWDEEENPGVGVQRWKEMGAFANGKGIWVYSGLYDLSEDKHGVSRDFFRKQTYFSEFLDYTCLGLGDRSKVEAAIVDAFWKAGIKVEGGGEENS